MITLIIIFMSKFKKGTLVRVTRTKGSLHRYSPALTSVILQLYTGDFVASSGALACYLSQNIIHVVAILMVLGLRNPLYVSGHPNYAKCMFKFPIIDFKAIISIDNIS